MLPTPDPTPIPVPSIEGYRAIPPPSASNRSSTPNHEKENDARPSTPSSSSRPRMTERYLRDGTSFRIGAIPVYEGNGSRQVSPAASSVYANDFGGQISQGPLDPDPQPHQLLEILQRQQRNPTPQQGQYPMTQHQQQSRPSSVVNQHQLHLVPSARRPQHLSHDPQDRLRQGDGYLAQQQLQRRGSQQHLNQCLQQARPFSPHTYQQQQQQHHSASLYQYQPLPPPHQDQMHLSQSYPGAPLIDSHTQLPPTPVSATSQASFILPPQALPQPSPSLGILIPHFEPSTGLTSFCTVEQLVQQRMQASATASAQELQSLRDELSAVKTNYTMVAAANSTLQTELDKSNALHKDAVSQVQVGGEGKDSAEVLALRQEIEDVKNKFNQLLFANNSLKSEHKGVQSLYRDAVSKNRVIEREREVSDLKKESNGRLETIKLMLVNQTAIEARENDAKLEAGKAKLQLANLQTNHTRKLEELDNLRTQCTDQSARLVETNSAALKSGCEIFSLRTKLESAIAQHTKETQDSGIRIAEMTLTNNLLSDRIKVLEATSSSAIPRPDTPPLPSADMTSTAALLQEKTKIIADLQLEISQLKIEVEATRSELKKGDKQESGFPWKGCASGEGDGEQERVKAKLLSQETRIQELSTENAALVLELDRSKNAFELEKVQNEWISNKRKTNEISAQLSITIDDSSPPSSPTTDYKFQAVKGCDCETTLLEIISRSEKVYVETLIFVSCVRNATQVKIDEVPLANSRARKAGGVILKGVEMIEDLVKHAREGVPSGV